MIYIIHGKDTFRSHKKLSGFISQAKKQGVEVFDFDFSDDLQVPILFQQLAQSFSSQGIFFTKKTIIIRHIIKLSPAHITFLIKLFKQRVQSHIVQKITNPTRS
jgi:DNA polymerase III delta subunit